MQLNEGVGGYTATRDGLVGTSRRSGGSSLDVLDTAYTAGIVSDGRSSPSCRSSTSAATSARSTST